MNDVKRILLITDVHYSEKSRKEDAKWYFFMKKFLPGKIADFYLRYWDNLTGRCFRKTLEMASEFKPFDVLLDLGDSTPIWRQEGLISKEAIRVRDKCSQMIDDFCGEDNVHKEFLQGNHDLGFLSKTSKILTLGQWTGRASCQSYEAAKSFIGPPWNILPLNNLHLLLLNSEIIKAAESESTLDKNFFVEEMKKQERFVENCLKNTSGKVVLAIHDFLKLEYLWPVLESYQERIYFTLAGHCHLISYEKKIKKTSSLAKVVNLHIIPSPFGIGIPGRLSRGGFAVLELSENSYELEYHWL